MNSSTYKVVWFPIHHALTLWSCIGFVNCFCFDVHLDLIPSRQRNNMSLTVPAYILVIVFSPMSIFKINIQHPQQAKNTMTRDKSCFRLCRCHPPMLWVTVLSLTSSSPRAISSVFIHRIILQRDSGRPAVQLRDAFVGRRDSLPAFCWAVLWKSGWWWGRLLGWAEGKREMRRGKRT